MSRGSTVIGPEFPTVCLYLFVSVKFLPGSIMVFPIPSKARKIRQRCPVLDLWPVHCESRQGCFPHQP